MTNESLARSYLRKASDRLDILDLLLKKGAYSDVMRKAQEIVELALKGMLRTIGIEPPKLHDVGGLLQEHRERLSTEIAHEVDELAVISKALRKERELAFYSDLDFIPTEEYSLADAEKAKDGAEKVVRVARRAIDPML